MEYLRVKLDHETVNCVIFFGEILPTGPVSLHGGRADCSTLGWEDHAMSTMEGSRAGCSRGWGLCQGVAALVVGLGLATAVGTPTARGGCFRTNTCEDIWQWQG